MQTPSPVCAVLALALVTGCGHSTVAASASTDQQPRTNDADPPPPAAPPSSCGGVGSSNLPGVCIWFPSDRGSWTLAEAAAGISIPYVVIVEADVADVITSAQDGGNCSSPGSSGLIVFEQLSGNEQQYCECDLGLCPGAEPVPVTIPAGQSPATFEWTGHNWYGPSDTNNPLGPPFPAGSYVLEISARGMVGGAPFEIRNRFTIDLTP